MTALMSMLTMNVSLSLWEHLLALCLGLQLMVDFVAAALQVNRLIEAV
jgi:hypothetical protein